MAVTPDGGSPVMFTKFTTIPIVKPNGSNNQRVALEKVEAIRVHRTLPPDKSINFLGVEPKIKLQAVQFGKFMLL